MVCWGFDWPITVQIYTWYHVVFTATHSLYTLSYHSDSFRLMEIVLHALTAFITAVLLGAWIIMYGMWRVNHVCCLVDYDLYLTLTEIFNMNTSRYTKFIPTTTSCFQLTVKLYFLKITLNLHDEERTVEQQRCINAQQPASPNYNVQCKTFHSQSCLRL